MKIKKEKQMIFKKIFKWVKKIDSSIFYYKKDVNKIIKRKILSHIIKKLRAIRIIHKSIVLLYIIGKMRIIYQNKEL